VFKCGKYYCVCNVYINVYNLPVVNVHRIPFLDVNFYKMYNTKKYRIKKIKI